MIRLNGNEVRTWAETTLSGSGRYLNYASVSANLNTDAVAMYLKSRQMPDGQWAFGSGDTRPPLCSLYIGQTALSMRALQLYAPKSDKAAYEKSIQLAAAWLARARPANNDDRGWRLLGLAWAGKDKDATRQAMRDLLAVQRADGGWSDIASMESTAYATGKALVALQTAGLPVSHAAYERAVRFLLTTQQEDGSWYVKTRAMAFQPYFDAGFPHGFDQWISAAGTSWATMALALAAPPPASLTEVRHHHSLTVVAQNASADLMALTEPRASASGSKFCR
ncbi:MAG: hypothetical protein HYS04_19865 [Acidobacteria bacterium]|nr:hypothetical protein [Acidobacteriota bacterium]